MMDSGAAFFQYARSQGSSRQFNVAPEMVGKLDFFTDRVSQIQEPLLG